MTRGEPSRSASPSPIPPSSALTARALVVGAVIGVVLAASNVFIGLKLGFYDPGAITAAILGFATLSVVGRSPSTAETASLAICASSAAVMAASTGLIGPVTAMIMLGAGVSMWAVLAWALVLGLLGIVLALPLRGPLIDHDGGLPFPTGRATAEVIESMVAARAAGARRAVTLGGSGLLAAAITWFRDGRPSWIPAAVPVPGSLAGHSLESLTLAVPISPLLWSVGALVGLRNGLSMVAGAAVAWLVLAPRLIDGGAVASAEFSDVVTWLLWPGAALLVTSTVTGLVLDRRALVRGVIDLFAARSGRGLAVLMLTLGVAAVLIGWLAIGVHPAAAVLGVAVAPILAAACARAEGETDLAPVGPVGGVAQIALGPVVPGNPIATLGGGAIVNGVAAQTAQTMYTLRAGQILGLSPRLMIVSQVVGAAVGTLAAIGAYLILTEAYTLGSDQLPGAAVQSWRATADAVARGLDAMPPGAPLAALIAGATGVGLTVLERGPLGRWCPAPVALGTACFIPGSYTIAIALGAAVYAGWQRSSPTAVERHGVSVATGGLAGEAVTGIVIALLLVLGALG